MNKYVKVPPLVAKKLGLDKLTTTKLPDGNYVAMATQFRDKKICEVYELSEFAPKMGCALITPLQLRFEREGKTVTPLPEPTLEEYKPQAVERPSVEEPVEGEVALADEEMAVIDAESADEGEEGGDE